MPNLVAKFPKIPTLKVLTINKSKGKIGFCLFWRVCNKDKEKQNLQKIPSKQE
jgi:hypothetical protein